MWLHRFRSLLLILLPIASSFCIDMYLPAYSAIAKNFAIPEGHMDLSLSIYLFGLATGQVVYGLLADCYGRRSMLLIGLGLFAFASVLCAFAPNYIFFLVARLLQSFGACSCIVLARTIVTDIYHPENRVRMLAWISATNIISPALAPLLGGVFVVHGSWRAIFYSIAAFGIIMAWLVHRIVPETLLPENRQPIRLEVQWHNLKQLLSNRTYIGMALCIGFVSATGYAWVTLSPSVLIHHFQVQQEKFGVYFAFPAIGSSLGALVTAQCSQYFPDVGYTRTGLGIILLSVLLALVFHQYINTPGVMVGFIVVLYFGIGMVLPKLVSIALSQFLNINGFASGVVGLCQSTIAALMGVITSWLYFISIMQLTLLLLVSVIGILLCFLYSRYGQHRSAMTVG